MRGFVASLFNTVAKLHLMRIIYDYSFVTSRFNTVAKHERLTKIRFQGFVTSLFNTVAKLCYIFYLFSRVLLPVSLTVAKQSKVNVANVLSFDTI